MGLKLSRKKGERIYIKRGDRVVVEMQIHKIKGKHVWININADENLRITRDKDWSEKRLDQEVSVSGVHDQI